MQDDEDNQAALIDLSANIVSAYVAKNSIPVSDLPALITAVHASLGRLGAPAEPEPAKREPRIPIRKSITPDALISLEDGRPYKTLKRHLAKLGLTPEAYRQKWSLPPDYPMVAASYAAQRSELAKSLGLGQIRRNRAVTAAAAAEPVAQSKAKVARTKASRAEGSRAKLPEARSSEAEASGTKPKRGTRGRPRKGSA